MDEWPLVALATERFRASEGRYDVGPGYVIVVKSFGWPKTPSLAHTNLLISSRLFLWVEFYDQKREIKISVTFKTKVQTNLKEVANWSGTIGETIGEIVVSINGQLMTINDQLTIN